MNSKKGYGKVSVIGAGSWGTTLAVILARKGLSVDLHSVFAEHNREMIRAGENSLFLQGVRFPSSLRINPELQACLESKVVVVAIPVKFLRGVLKSAASAGGAGLENVFVSVSKGIEGRSLKRVSEIFAEELGPVRFAALSGPNIAKEVLQGVPSTSVIACREKGYAKQLQQLFSTPEFRVYSHQDLTGVELGGALKNIIALACGISDGLGFGTNTKAALVTRGLVEITRLGKCMGAVQETFWGASGLGDLVTTCFSPHSRNRSVGERIGKGESIRAITQQMNMVAEGVETVKSAYHLSTRHRVEMPITHEVYKVLYKRKTPQKAVSDLMQRPLKTERPS
ncbi:MAG: NAD(P)H-dependent glycerol-3-phosphate dehydrogenase [Candidatus Omnitrophica bacterium]|nr:NAD(P)H-dependent glycerol-3-phosphate dehydrogenase [Candidatus Omnitrophota bacterium]